ncbi:unnamed protein product [Schistocephalus solidus]|uniref:Zinc finger E-box-binding homeobox 1 n=1 Tax=Schistocephalus solidus TaxID=70667 RepID=A0A183SRT6_SCHSO|nr:unnamed protein product [Schistocephalus solidus]
MATVPALQPLRPAFENPARFDLDQAIKAAAAAAVAAAKSSSPTISTSSLAQYSLPSVQVPIFNGFQVAPAHITRALQLQPMGLPGPRIEQPMVQGREACNAQSPTAVNLSSTAAIISALLRSPYSSAAKIDVYAPLLQLAVRQAVAECLSSFRGRINIEGQLLISTTDAGETSNVVVNFSDQSHSPQAASPHTSAPGDSPTSTVSCSSSSSVTNSPIISKRKSYHPTKCSNTGGASTNVASSPTSVAVSPPIVIPVTNREGSCYTQASGSTSPSTTDSGALDLSRAGSLSGSAPITPMKALSLGADAISYHPFAMLPQTNLIELYQKQLLAQGFLGQQQPRVLPTSRTPPEQPTPTLQSPNKTIRRRGPSAAGSVARRPNISRRFPCNQCREEFSSLHSLEEHTMGTHGTYRCHICRARFTQRSNLQRHALKHVGFKPFECRVCRKAYYRKDHLMRHMEMGHPGYSPRENITVHLTSSESLDYLNRNMNGVEGDDPAVQNDALASAAVEPVLDGAEATAGSSSSSLSDEAVHANFMQDTTLEEEEDEETVTQVPQSTVASPSVSAHEDTEANVPSTNVTGSEVVDPVQEAENKPEAMQTDAPV